MIPWTQIVKIGSDVVLVDLRQGLLESNELQESRSGGHSSGY